MSDKRSYTRRTFLTLTGMGVASTMLSVPVSASGATDFTNLGVNKFDADDSDGIDIYIVPTVGKFEGRAAAKRLVSDGASGDYLTSVIELPETKLSEFTGDDPTTLTYDYYDPGPDENDAATPDEVYLEVEVDGEPQTVYRTSNDNDEDDATGEWLTREVHKEIVGEPNFNDGFNWFKIEDDSRAKLNGNLVESLGEDAVITRIGQGGSNFGGDVETEFYVDRVFLDGEEVSAFEAEGFGDTPFGPGK